MTCRGLAGPADRIAVSLDQVEVLTSLAPDPLVAAPTHRGLPIADGIVPDPPAIRGLAGIALIVLSSGPQSRDDHGKTRSPTAVFRSRIAWRCRTSASRYTPHVCRCKSC